MTAMLSPTMPLDLFAKWQPLQEGGSGFYSGVDNDTGTVRMMGAGAWHLADAQRYFDLQRQVVELARRRFGSLKFFIDVRDWVVENPDSVTQFIAMNREMYRPDDRLVTVVKTPINKRHTRDALGVGVREAFVSMNAAETWLQAYSN